MSSMEEAYGMPLPPLEPKPLHPIAQKAIKYMEAWIADGTVVSPSDIQAAIDDLTVDGEANAS